MYAAKKNVMTAALFLSLGLILPFFTMQLPQFGNMLLPMHIPILLCGFICGPRYGAFVGLLTPVLRSLLFGLPPLFPIALLMAFELTAYGFMTGWLSHRFPRKPVYLWLSLIIAMLVGRLAWGMAAYVLFSFGETALTWQHFLNATILLAIPGIALQLLIIPPLVLMIDRLTTVQVPYDSKST